MMHFFKVASIVALAGSLAGGQDKPAETKPAEARPPEAMEAVIIPVKTLSGDSFNRMAKMLLVFNVKYQADERLRTIVVYAPKDVVAQMRRVVEELDRPGSEAAIGKNIDMTLAFLFCSTKAATEARDIPADLEPVAKQLRAATPYKDIRVLDVMPIRAQEGKDTFQQSHLPGLSNVPGQLTMMQIRLRPEAVFRKDTGRFVRFDWVKVDLRIPYATGPSLGEKPGEKAGLALPTQFQYRDVGVNTAGDFKEGQKTVLGKVSGVDEESSIFVVISLKVLD